MNSQVTKESNYEIVFGKFKEQFLQSPQEQIADKIGARIDETYIYLPFFGETSRINRRTGEITGNEGRKIPVTERLTIMHHLHYCQKFAKEGTKMIPFREVKEAAVFEKAYEKAALEPLKKYFGGRPGKLLEARKKMGGKEERYGDVSVRIQAFPKIGLVYIFWDGDEEFPPSANILFDNTISQWTHPESIPTLAQIGTEKLIQTADGKASLR